MKMHRTRFATAGSVAALTLACTSAWADTLADNPLIGTSGDGLIFVDPEEGVVEPGVKAVTFTSTRDTILGGLNFVPPYENIITDYTFADAGGLIVDGREAAPNCLMASNPGIFCDSAPGSGKRIKTQLTGPDPFEMTFQTNSAPYITESGTPLATPSVDYFTFGKTSNFTGARITSFTLELLDSEGEPMRDVLNSANTVLFLTADLDGKVLGGAGLPDGLFGEGGNEGDIGFFSGVKATPTILTRTSDVTTFEGISSGADNVYDTFFGDAFLDDTMVPDGLFWDDNSDPTDESALVAWNNIAGGGWTYGNLALTEAEVIAAGDDPDDFVLLPERLNELADTLDVPFAVLEQDYLDETDGGLVSDEIVAAALANGLFDVAAIEDLRNSNLNFTMRVGTPADGEFTLRINPEFAEFVESFIASGSEYQFKLAGYLDAAANVPYWDIYDNDGATFQAVIDAIDEVDEADRAAALTSTGFNIAPAYSSMSFESARGHVAAITGLAPIAGGDAAAVSQGAGAQSWLMGGNLFGLASLGGSTATYDATASSIGYDVDATSFTVGAESRVNANISVGIAVGGTSATAEAADGLSDLETTGLSLIGFARSSMDNGASIKALFGYQSASYDSTRNVMSGTPMAATATGSTNGSQTFGAVEADFMRDFGAFAVGPMASAAFYDVTIDGFTETGADAMNLTVEEQSGSTFVGSIGVKGEYMLPSATGQNRLTGSLAYSTLSSDDLVIESGFDGLPTVSFPVDGRDDNLIDVRLGFESLISSNTARDIRIEAGYGGSFGDDYERHSFQVGMNMQF